MPQVTRKTAVASATTSQPPVSGTGTALSPRLSTVIPTQMTGGGLPSQFWGVIQKLRFMPRTYPSGPQAGKYFLGVEQHIMSEDPSMGKNGLVVDTLNAGDLHHWVPCMDGANPTMPIASFLQLADGQAMLDPAADNSFMEGIYALGIGTQESTSPDSKWAQWLRTIMESGFPENKMGVACSFAEGLRCYFTRMPYVNSKGQPPKGQAPDKEIQVLVPTQIDPVQLTALQGGKPATGMNLGATGKMQQAASPAATAAIQGQPVVAQPVAQAPVAAPTTPKATAAKGPPSSPEAVAAGLGANDGALEVQVEEAIYTLLQGAADGQMMYQQLGVPVTKVFTGAAIGKAVRLVGSVQWLGADARTRFGFDPGAGAVVLMEESQEGDEAGTEEVTA